MKKRMISLFGILAVVATLVLSGCNESAEVASESVGIPNPWTEDENAEAAAQAAVVGYFDLPENGTEYEGGRLDWMTFRHMDSLAEAEGNIGAAEIVVRKGLKQNSDDVSGDYTEYAHEWTQEVDYFTVKCYGQEESKTMKAIWLSNNFSYSIIIRGQGDDAKTYGISDSDIDSLVRAIQ